MQQRKSKNTDDMDDEWRASQSRTREERGKVNEEEKGEDADDTKPIFRVHLEEQEMRRAREGSNALKTGFWRCIMQITIAIKVPYHQYGSEENNCENPDDRKWIADDTKQIADGTKQINRRQEVCGSPWVPIL
ncbi:hypothetical protein T4B_3820 [Trichinella pseudospiralis]|uniref:Uncharacterized protein n=1 Tax=Trichinella pseudospiralis TaxID=6337 RepID=A0A0V1IDS9_TRIPS|nr:hypothetical protein T4B_3820 [Trichinella pseudospiralis]